MIESPDHHCVADEFVACLLGDGSATAPRDRLGPLRRTRGGTPVTVMRWPSSAQVRDLERAVARRAPVLVLVEPGTPREHLEELPGTWTRTGDLRGPLAAVLLDPLQATPSRWDTAGPDLVFGLGGGQLDSSAATIAALAVAVDETLALFADGPVGIEGERLVDVELTMVVPAVPGAPYSMDDVVARLVDGGTVASIERPAAPELLTAVARVDGRLVAVVASRPDHEGGRITAAGIRRLRRFISFVEAVQLPLLSIADSQGFDWSPRPATLHDLFDVLARLYHLSTPKCTILAGDAIGVAAALLGVVGMRADWVAAWPRARVAADGALADPTIAARSSAFALATDGVILDVVDPDTTPVLIRDLLQMLHVS